MRREVLIILIASLFSLGAIHSADAEDALAAGLFAFTPKTEGASELKVVEGVPVATLRGTPSEIGDAFGRLAREQIRGLWEVYVVPMARFAGGVEKLSAEAAKMDSHIPERYRQEMKALAAAAGLDYEAVAFCNAFPDIYRKGSCSTFAASGSATKDGRPLLGRNLDFMSGGILQKASLVVLFQPEGSIPFASVTWPGVSGVLTGMNAAGLCAAVMEVREGGVTTEGIPSTFLFRRVMEEADSVEEGLAILAAANIVAGNNLMLVDREGRMAVAELAPGKFRVRRPSDGILSATNHHREGKEKPPQCGRFARCEIFAAKKRGSIDVDALKDLLREVNQGMMTLQSMILEPAALRIHLATGTAPASEAAYATLEWQSLLVRAARLPDTPKQ